MNADSHCALKDSFRKEQTGLVEEQFNEFPNARTYNSDGRECSMKELGIEYTCHESANVSNDNGEAERHQDCSEETKNTENSMMPSTTTGLIYKCDHENTTQLNGNVTDRSPTIELNSMPAEPNKSDTEQNVVNQQRLPTNLKDYKYDIGESSFSAIGPPPNLRSDSALSDSSATSTRSFAFPILHSEWNSSPVKLINTDQRHDNPPKSHRRSWWASCICCCRF